MWSDGSVVMGSSLVSIEGIRKIIKAMAYTAQKKPNA